jgi:iron complex transport system substrate-binding protein
MFLWLTVAVAVAAAPEWVGAEATASDRIVSLAPSVTEILFALGAGEQVVGVTRYDDYPEAVRRLPKVGGFIDPDPEAVVALAPDLVIAVRTSGGRARIDTLARHGLSVLVVPAETTDDLWVAIGALGDVTGRAEAAASLTSRLKAELAAIRERYRKAPPLRVLVVVGHRPLVVSGPGTYLDSLLGHLAAENVVTAGGAYPQLDLEATLALDPDAIVDVAMVRADPGFWKRFGVLRAVRRDRVIAVDGESLLRPGPRLTAGLRELGRSLRAQP